MMKLVPLNKVFQVSYGTSLEFNRLEKSNFKEGVAFVSRTSKNNGISGFVEKVDGVKLNSGHTLSVAVGGSVLETFYQPRSFYTGYHVMVLSPIEIMEEKTMHVYCAIIRANKYRYNYGRQANKTLTSILIPDHIEAKKIASKIQLPSKPSKKTIKTGEVVLNVNKWVNFEYETLFDIERGRGPRKSDLADAGSISFVSASECNNGLTGKTTHKAIHKGGVISVVRNGNSVASAFYQKDSFCSTEDVHIFYPKFPLNQYIALFLCTLIKREKYRFNYGRKWGLARMNESTIKLPVTSKGNPDWKFMEDYIKSLPYTSNLK